MKNRFFPDSSKAETKEESSVSRDPIFPFADHKDYCSWTIFNRFSQDSILKKGQKGLCLALCCEWLGSFYNNSDLFKNPFWQQMREERFIAKLMDIQQDFNLPNITQGHGFKIKIAAFAKSYGFNGYARMSSRSDIKDPGLTDLISDLILNNAGKIIILSKGYFDETDDHAIAVACKMNMHGIQIGLFEPNLGEALFTYSLLEASQDLRLTWEVNPFQDNHEPIWRKTFYEFCTGLFHFYSSYSLYQSYRCVSLDHQEHQSRQENTKLAEIRRNFVARLCLTEDNTHPMPGFLSKSHINTFSI